MSLSTWSPLRTFRNIRNHLRDTMAARGGARSAPAARSRVMSESLERRMLLTTLNGGDVFEYVDASGEIVRIRLEGNIRAEFIGATANGPFEPADATNLPGNLNGADIFGGLGGPGGIDIIGPVGGITNNINAIAADNTGRMFALELQEVPIPNPPTGGPDTRNLVYLVELTFPPAQPPSFPLPPPYGPRREVGVQSTLIAEISDAIVAQSGGVFPTVNTVPAADFNPTNGLLYFVATGADGNFDKLFTVDVNAGGVGGVAASVNGIAGFFNDPGEDGITVASIAFDQVPGGTQLVALIGEDQGAGGGGGGADQVIGAQNPFIAVVNQNNTDLMTVLDVDLIDEDGERDQDGPELSGIEILDENTTEVNDLLAVGSEGAFRIFRTASAPFIPGDAILLGELTEPVPPGLTPPVDPTGGEPSGLMFVPGMLDPFTNSLGAYIAFDQNSESKKLFWVNRAAQQAVTIFQVYVASSDLTGRIAISRVPPLDQPGPRPMTPFDGDVGDVRHLNAQDPAQFPWPADAPGSNTGQVFIGARVPQDVQNWGGTPILTARIPATLNTGLMPTNNLPIDPVTGERLVTAGMTVNGDMDRFLLGGAMTGDVIINGSINQFYAGWVLTGNARGDVAGASPSRPQNFRAFGDIRELYVLDSLGTHAIDPGARDQPTYITGFDLQTGGTLGHVRTGDSWLGAFQTRNQPEEDATRGIDIPQTEMEGRTDGNGPAWDGFLPSGNAIFFNDTFDTPEYRGSINSLGQADMVHTLGLLQHVTNFDDWVDYYAIGVMAGQEVQVQLFPEFPAILNVGVFDPDGRLIASDHSNSFDASGLVFGFIADKPGAYRFAVSAAGNVDFLNSRQSPLNAPVGYDLRVTGVGDIGVGGIEVANQMLDVPVLESIGPRAYLLEFGDIGDIRAGDAILSLSIQSTVKVTGGNLRSLDGGQIGFGTAAVPGDPNDPNNPGTAATLNAAVELDVPAGSVGLVRARAGILFLNSTAPFLGRSIGGDYQVIDGATSVGVDLLADGGLGVLRAGDMATNPASSIVVNFDDSGRDGIIDLIDVAGQLGTLGAGGPAITTNTGGNVRYMRAGGLAFIDLTFGGGFPIFTDHVPGEVVTLQDDGGASIRITPVGVPVANPAFNPADPTDLDPPVLFSQPNALTLRSYPIRGSGGVVVMDINSDDSVVIDTVGGEGATAEIGTIRLAGARAVGAGVVRDPNMRIADFTSLLDFFLPETRGRREFGFAGSSGAPLPLPAGFDPINPGSGGGLGEPDYRRAPNPLQLTPPIVPGAAQQTGPIKQILEVIVRGNIKTDIFSIVGVDGGFEGDGQFSTISNETNGGEIVNISAVSVGEIISNGTIGLARPSISNVAVNARVFAPEASVAFPGDAFPLLGHRYGIWIHGDLDEEHDVMPFLIPITAATQLPEPGNVISIRARDGLGNIIVNGNIGELIPNKDGLRNRPGIFAGIQGPVWARGNIDIGQVAGSDEGGDIYYVDIGEGIAATGSGAFSRAGLYGGRRIDTVVGDGADIRGDIIAGDVNNLPDPQPVNVILNGALVASGRRINIPDSIGRITLTDGSIINADIMVTSRAFESREQPFGLTNTEFSESVSEPFFEIGRIEVRGNGGIIGALVTAADVGLIDVNRGFGIFSTVVTMIGDARFLGMESDNYGIRNVFASSGANMNFINARGDGSSVSTAGFNGNVRRSEGYGFARIDPLTGMAPNALTDIHAVLGTSAAQPEIAGRTDTGIIEDVVFRGQRNLGSIRAQQIRATNPEVAPSIINFANTVSALHVRDQINGLTMTTGKFGTFRPQGDVFNLDLTVAGPIKDLLINGDLADGSVIRTQGRNAKMGNIRINGRLDGDVLASGPIKRLFVGEAISGNVAARGKKIAISQLIVGGPIAEGGLNVQGSIGKMIVVGSFGVTGSQFTVNGNIKSLTITGDLFADIRVDGSINKFQVGGSIITGSTVDVGGRINVLIVNGDLQPGATIRAAQVRRERIRGQMLGQIIETA